MSVIEQFRVFDWLKTYFPYDSIGEEDMAGVLHFCLMWNLFESKICERHASIGKIKNFTKSLRKVGSLKNEDFSSYLLYFQERYLCNGKTNDKFARLRIGGSDREQVESVLKEEEAEHSSVVLALLIIVYRLRNTLFHGEKPIITLHNQNINFNVANSLLAKTLDLHKDNR
ncbi:MAG: hypothetical protein P8Z79_25955 [Sedimentisphaerales bacterium]|jgi:hypothetical protein